MAEEAPEPGTPEGHGLYLKDSAGNIQPVQTADIQPKLQIGWKPASPEEVKDFQLQAKFGGAAEGAKAFGEGLGQALTFGGLTPLETHVFGVKPENISGRQEARSGLHMAGMLTGVALPAAVSLGSSLLGSGAEAAAAGAEAAPGILESFSAPGLISKAGEAASEAASGGMRSALMGEAAGPLTLGQSVAQRAVGMGAGSALEGGLYSGAQAVHELGLGDPNLKAQDIVEHIGLGTLLGGGIGVLAGAGNEILPELIRKGRDATASAFSSAGKGLSNLYGSAEAATGTSADVVTTMFEHRQEIATMAKAIPGVADTISNSTPEMANWIVKNGGKLADYEQAFPGTTKMLARVDPKTADFLLDNWQKIVTDPQARIDMASNLREGIQGVLDTTGNILKRINTEFAPGEEESFLGGGEGEPLAATRNGQEAYGGIMKKVQEASEAMRAQPDLYSKATAATLEDIYGGLGRDADGVKNDLGVFRRLKDLRQQVGSNTSWKTMPGDIEAQNTSRLMKGLYHDINGVLRDPEVFGEVAARREALDQVQKEWLELTGKKGDFKKLFLDGAGKVPSTKIDTWLNAMAKDKGVEGSEAWGKIMDLSKRIADEAETSWKSNPVAQFDREAADSLFNKTAKAMEEAKTSAKATGMQKYLSSGGVGIPNSGPVQPNAFMQAANVAGHFMPNIITNTFKTVTSVPRAVATLSALERIGMSMGKRIESLAEAIARGEEDTAAGVAGAVGKDYLRDSSQERILERLEKAAAGVTGEEMGSSAEKHLSTIRTLANSPNALSEKLHSGLLDEHAPQTTQALQAHLSKTLQYVAGKFPEQANSGPLGRKLPMSKTDNHRLRKTLETVSAPATVVMRDILNGRLTPSVVADAHAVAPEQMARVKAAILEKISGSKKPLPYARKMMLSMLLGQPLDPGMSQQAIALNQAAFNRPSAKSGEDQLRPMGKPTQGGMAKLNVSGHAMLPGQAVESRRSEA